MSWTLLQNSLVVASATAGLTLLCGGLAALAVCGLWPAMRSTALGIAVAVLMLPPFLVSNTWLNYFGLNGTWRHWLDFDVYSLKGTVLILTLQLWPIAFLLLYACLRRIDRVYLEQHNGLRCSAALRLLIWPACRGAAGLAAVLIFVLALNNFTVPALLQTKVFAAEVWLSFNTKFDYGEALRLSWPLLAAPLALMLFWRTGGARFANRSNDFPGKLWRAAIGWLFPASCPLAVLLILLSLGLPLMQLLTTRRTWQEFMPAFEAGQSALQNSLIFAFAGAAVVSLAGALLARWRAGMAGWLFFLTPGVLLGIALIRLFNQPALNAFYQSIGIVVLAFGVRYFALGWAGARAAFGQADQSTRQILAIAGASSWQQFRLALWPQSRRVLLGTFYLVYLFCLWEVETLILIVPPGRETLALRIFNMLHYGHAGQVDALCVWMLLLGLAPALLYLAGRRLAVLALPFLLVGCGDGGDASHGTKLQSRFFSAVEVYGSRGTGAGQFNKPRSIAVDRQDNFYVVDITGRVQKFSPDGKFLLSWQMPETDKGKPKGMICDADGNIIVVEPHYSRVNHFSPEGKLLAQWGENGTNDGQLFFPRCVAVNSRGELYLSEYGVVERIQRFTHRGAHFLGSIGHSGTESGELNRGEGVGIAPDDTLFEADSCNHRVQVFSPEGKVLTSFGSPGSGPNQMSYPYDVRIDPLGYRYVCEFGNSRIQIFNQKNESLEILGRPGAAPGELNNPWAIALDSRGNLYVADSLNHRIQKFIRREPLTAKVRTVAKR